MKKLFNLTTCKGEMNFLADPNETARQFDGYDGIELQIIDDPEEGLIDPALVVGLHMACVPCWYALWAGDEKGLLDEFGTLEEAERYYGGPLTRETLLNKFRRDLYWADRFSAEYLVFHIAESRVIESFTEDYLRTDEEICKTCAEILDTLFADRPASQLLLLENLWQPGMNLRRPEITRDMLAAVKYPNKGIMLDTGHLMNTNTAVNTQEQGLAWIHRVLDAHKSAGFDLCSAVRGMHLNASISGALAERVKKDPPKLEGSYQDRTSKMFFHVFERDQHKPFVVSGVKELVEHLSPDYLTTEIISFDLDDRREKNMLQLESLL